MEIALVYREIQKLLIGNESIVLPKVGKLTVVAKSAPTIKVGSTVKVKFCAKDLNNNKSLALWAYARKYKVKELKGNRAVLTYNGEVITAMDIKNLTLV
jgi:hypothetical protein